MQIVSPRLLHIAQMTLRVIKVSKKINFALNGIMYTTECTPSPSLIIMHFKFQIRRKKI